MLFALAALAGAVGFAFGLFDEIVPYDEITHAFTTFCLSLTFYFLFYGGAVPESRAFALGTSVFTLGVTVGDYWKIFEWFFVGKYPMADTRSDLLVDSARALGESPSPKRSILPTNQRLWVGEWQGYSMAKRSSRLQ